MRVVIVGGGFGGVRTALNLAKNLNFDVVLVSKKPYFEYHSALYRSATGRSPREVAVSLSDFFARDENITVIQDEILHIDAKKKIVSGLLPAVYHYDVLIMAVGSATQYFGIKGLSDFSSGINTLEDALKLKSRLHDDLVLRKQAEHNYVVVGGGPTGIELSGELVGYLKHIRKQHHIATKFNVDLIEASASLLPSLPARFTDRIKKQQTKLGVRLRFNTAVQSETVDEIILPHGKLSSHMVMWTAGLTNNSIFGKFPELFRLGSGGKVIVDQYLGAYPGIYILGDGALTQYSGMAQTAIHDANFLTGNLKRVLHGDDELSYLPKRPVYAIPAGPYWAAVLWGNVRVYGYAGWMLRRLADLRLYLLFLSPAKALGAWRSGFVIEETCLLCKK